MTPIQLTSAAALLGLIGCRTLDPQAESAQIIDSAANGCKHIGVVNVDWSWWGTSTESLNGMRNQTAALGGNSLLVRKDVIATAYRCPVEKSIHIGSA